MTPIQRLVALAAAGAFASPALAASVAQSEGSFVLRLNDVPSGVFAFEAADDSQTWPHASLLASGADRSAQARAEMRTMETVEVADAFGPGASEATIPFVFLRNFDGPNPDGATTGPIAVSGVLDYDLAAFAAVDDPLRDRAHGYARLDFYLDGSPLDGDSPIFTAVAEAHAPTGGPMHGAASGAFPFAVTLDPMGLGRFDTVRLGVFLEVASVAEDLSPVPLPAGLPVTLAALGGLAVLGRRRAAGA